MFQTTHVLFVTTNGTINARGELVMGRGAALEAKVLFPELPCIAAQQIRKFGAQKAANTYVYYIEQIPEYNIGLFQVKYHWREEADIALIYESAFRLTHLACAYPSRTFALNFPGIGNGRLTKERVMPLLQTLPDNVHIYEL